MCSAATIRPMWYSSSASRSKASRCSSVHPVIAASIVLTASVIDDTAVEPTSYSFPAPACTPEAAVLTPDLIRALPRLIRAQPTTPAARITQAMRSVRFMVPSPAPGRGAAADAATRMRLQQAASHPEQPPASPGPLLPRRERRAAGTAASGGTGSCSLPFSRKAASAVGSRGTPELFASGWSGMYRSTIR